MDFLTLKLENFMIRLNSNITIVRPYTKYFWYNQLLFR